MLNVLIISATELEVKPFFNKFTKQTVLSPNCRNFCIHDLSVDVLITGIGMVPTTYYLTKALTQKKYDYVFNVGIAGAYDKKMKLGSVVHVFFDVLSEMGISSPNGFVTLNKALNTKELEAVVEVENSNPVCVPSVSSLDKVKGISVNTVSGDTDLILHNRNLYNPDVETMEGAAFLYVCNNFNVKASQIRAISNYVEPRNKNNWRIGLAVNNLSEFLYAVLNEL